MDSASALKDIEEKVIAAWEEVLGKEGVLSGQNAERHRGQSRIRRRRIVAVLFPSSTADVVAIVRIASHFHMPLYPISGGYNYGYGGPSPVVDGCSILDLSR